MDVSSENPRCETCAFWSERRDDGEPAVDGVCEYATSDEGQITLVVGGREFTNEYMLTTSNFWCAGYKPKEVLSETEASSGGST